MKFVTKIKKMKLIVTILLLTFSFGCKSQNNPEKVETEKTTELKPPFKNQGEQEKYWAQEFFKEEYKKKHYSKFVGEIEKSENKIKFGKVQYVELFDTNSDYNLIFEKGLFYPDILSAISLRIGNLEELEFLSKNPKVKRFWFWLYQPNMANPQVYLFELTNEKANEKTDWKSFIKNAELTFVKNGWIII
ncbi:hypothetical protein [Winogradskyella damuponensis]|jgi:hypothetical protein|uniref:Lipoprotein n=2 Tax=Winogradskyella TaxID=286104 RepID=A0ABP8CIS5_9FLAO